MSNRNWDKARAIDRARKPSSEPVVHFAAPDPDRTPFPIVYARYANAEKRAGRKPLPPRQWIASLKQNNTRRT
ncbi:MAG TPA: hypothetical protein VL614_15115 [Acetobacteraceae bacterium]|jgi:hypothetical protein|nr:hypothetical protein [Acetobacteraceae bacterium]